MIQVPYIKGMPVNNLIPMAIPKTSAKSVAAIANSAKMYKLKLTAGGYVSRLACAKSSRRTIPNLALKLCKRIAMILLKSKIQIS